jgi:hypothetical protein
MIPKFSEEAIQNSRIADDENLYPRFCKAVKSAKMQDFEEIWKSIFIGNDYDIDSKLKKAGF